MAKAEFQGLGPEMGGGAAGDGWPAQEIGSPTVASMVGFIHEWGSQTD